MLLNVHREFHSIIYVWVGRTSRKTEKQRTRVWKCACRCPTPLPPPQDLPLLPPSTPPWTQPRGPQVTGQQPSAEQQPGSAGTTWHRGVRTAAVLPWLSPTLLFHQGSPVLSHHPRLFSRRHDTVESGQILEEWEVGGATLQACPGSEESQPTVSSGQFSIQAWVK